MPVETVHNAVDAFAAEQQAVIHRLTNELALTTDELAETQAEYAAHMTTHGTPLPEPEPNPLDTTLMGVTVTGAVRKSYLDLHDDVDVSRVFAQTMAGGWANEDQHKAFPNSRWACSNTHSLSLSAMPAALASIPAADKKKIVAWCDTHECEHPDKHLIASEFKARMRESAKIIHDAGLKVASCVMGFSIPNDKWLQWIDPDVVDYIMFDKYNSGQKKNPPVYQGAVQMVDNMVALSKRLGKPWGLWETGTNQFGTDAARVQWTHELRAECTKQQAVTAIWFDRPSTAAGSTWDATLEPKAAAEAWLL